MTHSSNIPVSDQLQKAFGDARASGNVRFIKVSIEDESLVPVATQPVSADAEHDFAKVVPNFERHTAAFVLYRLDSTDASAGSHEWVLLSYVPDGSPVKQRMLYASTRDYLKRQLGKNYFAYDFYGSAPEDFTWEAFQESLKKPQGTAPLTADEVQRSSMAGAEIDPGHTREYVHSVKFPLSIAAQNALRNLTPAQNYAQISVDTVKETVELVEARQLSASDIASRLPSNEPRFVFFRWSHTHNGGAGPVRLESNVFIYWCPETAPIKAKMLYSTVKSVVAGAAEDAGVTFEKAGKLEASELEDVTEEAIREALHPTAEDGQKAFARPRGPGRGPARLNRTRNK